MTICVQDRNCLFGLVENGEMVLNDFGKIAPDELLRTNDIIVHITYDISRRGELHSLNDGNGNIQMETFSNEDEFNSPQQTVVAIVWRYKSAVTKQLNVLGFSGKLWQRNYYEYIIRTPEIV